jgi:hypothetical protein
MYSGLAGIIASIDGSIADMQKESDRISKLSENLSIGTSCPACLKNITREHFEMVTAHVEKEIKALTDRAEPLKKRREWLLLQEHESRKNFNERVEKDMQEYEKEIFNTRKKIQEVKLSNTSKTTDFEKFRKAEISRRRDDIGRIEKEIDSQKSSYSRTLMEYQKKTSSRKDEIFKEIETLQAERNSIADAEKLAGEIKKTKGFIADIDKSIKTASVRIDAAIEYAAKRAQISLKPLKMKHVDIKLHEIVRSTGEVVNTFKFTYEGRDYKILSLSEKIKAGLEVSSLIRRLAGRDYPVLVDNTESITTLDCLEGFSQAILTKVLKDSHLMVEDNILSKDRTFKESV